MRCPNCGNQLDEFNYCSTCCEYFDSSDDMDDNYFDSSDDMDDNYFDESPDYESMINNGDEICLNCTYWSVSPYGSSHGMYCRRGNGQTEPGDSCFDFSPAMSFASYGDNGQYQFNETEREISNKLYHWRNGK